MNDTPKASPFRFFTERFWKPYFDYKREIEGLTYHPRQTMKPEDMAEILRKIANDLELR